MDKDLTKGMEWTIGNGPMGMEMEWNGRKTQEMNQRPELRRAVSVFTRCHPVLRNFWYWGLSALATALHGCTW